MSGVSIATGVIATDALGGGQGRGLQSPGVLAQSAVPASVTGTTSETVLATIPIPAGAVGVNGSLRIKSWWSAQAANANSKTLRYRLNGVAAGFSSTLTNNLTTIIETELLNRGAANSQVFRDLLASPFGGFTTAFASASIDTTAAVTLTITAQLGVGTDTVTLDGYRVEVLNP